MRPRNWRTFPSPGPGSERRSGFLQSRIPYSVFRYQFLRYLSKMEKLINRVGVGEVKRVFVYKSDNLRNVRDRPRNVTPKTCVGRRSRSFYGSFSCRSALIFAGAGGRSARSADSVESTRSGPGRDLRQRFAERGSAES